MDSIKGRICLVTGATDGIGKATAAGLAKRGADVVVVGRNRDKIDRTVTEISTASGNALVQGLQIDLASLESIRNGANEFKRRFDRLDVLINNAGVVTRQRELSVDGYELQFAVNHLAPFLLTNLLLDRLRGSTPARIVNVSSFGHTQGQIHFDDLQFEQNYQPRQAYYQTRLASVLFTYAVARRLEGSGITANCLHPGIVRTNLSHGYMGNPVFRFFESLISISPEQGAATSLYLATSSEVATVTGGYFIKQRQQRSADSTYDHALQDRLWQVSAQLTGLTAAATSEVVS